MRGPLDILRESWKANKHSSESIVSYVLSIQEKLVKMSTLAQENLAKAQVQQKRWYDRNAREREFQPRGSMSHLIWTPPPPKIGSPGTHFSEIIGPPPPPPPKKFVSPWHSHPTKAQRL